MPVIRPLFRISLPNGAPIRAEIYRGRASLFLLWIGDRLYSWRLRRPRLIAGKLSW